MRTQFELEWRGGAAEKHFRRLRPMDPDLPWGSLDTKCYPPDLVERARASWTRIARSEYNAAAAFADVLGALLAAQTPVDIVGMASDFIADELSHVELASRIAMELGGGVPIDVDFAQMGVQAATPCSPRARANELVVRVACVSETLSAAVAVGMMREVTHPLVSAVVERIARDEARHTRLGWVYLEWAVEEMDDDERSRLGAIARTQVDLLSPGWKRRTSRTRDGITSEGYRLEDIHDLGWMESQNLVALATETVQHAFRCRGLVARFVDARGGFIHESEASHSGHD